MIWCLLLCFFFLFRSPFFLVKFFCSPLTKTRTNLCQVRPPVAGEGKKNEILGGPVEGGLKSGLGEGGPGEGCCGERESWLKTIIKKLILVFGHVAPQIILSITEP